MAEKGYIDTYINIKDDNYQIIKTKYYLNIADSATASLEDIKSDILQGYSILDFEIFIVSHSISTFLILIGSTLFLIIAWFSKTYSNSGKSFLLPSENIQNCIGTLRIGVDFLRNCGAASNMSS